MEWTDDGKRKYPHMCRDGHVEIGYSVNSGECPVCSLRNAATHAADIIDRELHHQREKVVDASAVLRGAVAETDAA